LEIGLFPSKARTLIVVVVDSIEVECFEYWFRVSWFYRNLFCFDFYYCHRTSTVILMKAIGSTSCYFFTLSLL